MKNKVLKSVCILLVAVLFITSGVVLKIFSDKEPGEKDRGFTDKIEHEKEEKEEPEKVDKLVFTDAPEGYFNDALFIGDSRTVGMAAFGPIEGATYFASVGLNVYRVDEEVVEVDGIGQVTLPELLSSNTYGKIYVMLGVNELGNDFDTNVSKYKELIDYIRQVQPEAIIFIEANLRVGAEKSNSGSAINNDNLDRFNQAIAEFANDIDTVYVDVNPIFDDGSGNLNSECTGDDVHLYANYYTDWANWLHTKAAVKESTLKVENES